MFEKIINKSKEKVQELIDEKKKEKIEKQNKIRQIYLNRLETQEKLKSFKCITNGKHKFYINEELEEWYYPNNEFKFYHFNDVFACEIIEDQNIINTTVSRNVGKKHVSLGKAVVGGVLLGPAGAIIGGGAGKTVTSGRATTTSDQICRKLSILVKLKSYEEPLFEIKLITINTNKNLLAYRNAMDEAQTILSVFQLMINNQNNQEE